MKQIDRNICKIKVNIICKLFCIDFFYFQVYISCFEFQYGNCFKNFIVVDDYMDKYGFIYYKCICLKFCYQQIFIQLCNCVCLNFFVLQNYINICDFIDEIICK